MRLSFIYGSRTILFDVIYKKRKTMEIRVEPPDKVSVKAPVNVPESVILEKVKSKAPWIVQKLFAFKNMQYIPVAREFVNGESFLYLGRNNSLQLELDETLKKPIVKLHRGKFLVQTPTRDQAVIREAMRKWYRKRALVKIRERVEYYQTHFSKKPAGIRVKEQRKRWGSCTAKDDLLFNWRIIMAPSPVLDYIIVHEMCHMNHKDHSKAFWDSVASIMPEYKGRQEWLRNNGIRMDL